MAASTFDILDYLSGLTNFIFDKSVLNRVAIECGVRDASSYVDITEEQRDHCKMALFETIVYGPHQTASVSNQHGSYTSSVGAQTITTSALESIKSELSRLYKKYDEEDKIEALAGTGGGLMWIPEND